MLILVCVCSGPSRIQTDFAAMSLGSQDTQPNPNLSIPKSYETASAGGIPRGKSPEKKVMASPSKAAQIQVKKPTAPVKVEPTNPFDEDEDEILDSSNPFATDVEEKKTTNPFDEPDDYDKEKNPFGCS